MASDDSCTDWRYATCTNSAMCHDGTWCQASIARCANCYSPKLCPIGDNVTLPIDCSLQDTVTVGEGSKFGKGCQIKPKSSIGKNTQLADVCIVG